MCTHNKCFHGEIRKRYYIDTPLSGAMVYSIQSFCKWTVTTKAAQLLFAYDMKVVSS